MIKTIRKQTLLLLLLTGILTLGKAQQNSNRWEINNEGGITWEIDKSIPHHDHIEMSGKRISAVVSYGVEADQSFFVKRDLVWPMLRTIPNNTHASLMHAFSDDIVKSIQINGNVISEKVQEISLDGTINTTSLIGKNIVLNRTCFPSTELPVYFENYIIKNNSLKTVQIEIPRIRDVVQTTKDKGVYGI